MATRFSLSLALPRIISAAALITAALAVPVRAQTLTDIVLFRTDGAGNSIAEGWNTRGSDAISNLYLTQGITAVNSGNGAGASVAIDLSVPGAYTFDFAGDNVNGNTAPPLAINFFFNSNAATPRISARGLGGGTFFALSGVTNTPGFGTVPGSGSLSFTDNGRIITLTAFTYQTSSGANRVTPTDNIPGGTADSVGSFTLTVSPVTVPEASPLTLVVAGGMAAGLLRRRRK